MQCRYLGKILPYHLYHYDTARNFSFNYKCISRYQKLVVSGSYGDILINIGVINNILFCQEHEKVSYLCYFLCHILLILLSSLLSISFICSISNDI